MSEEQLLAYAETELNFYLDPNSSKKAMLGRLGLLSLGSES